MEANKIGNTKVHEVANFFPMIEGDEFSDLMKDIKANGILNPLIYDAEGQLVDGRNRLKAAKLLKIPEAEIPKKHLAKTTTEKDLIELVLTENVFRRHLDKASRTAAVAAAMRRTGELDKLEEEAKELAKKNRVEHIDAVNAAKAKGEKPPKKTKRQTFGKVAEEVAKKAKVSPATAARVLRTEKTDPVKFSNLVQGKSEDRRGMGKRTKFRVPRDPQALGTFLAEELELKELRILVAALREVAPKAFES